jgi:hypothetical protein
MNVRKLSVTTEHEGICSSSVLHIIDFFVLVGDHLIPNCLAKKREVCVAMSWVGLDTFTQQGDASRLRGISKWGDLQGRGQSPCE